MAGLPYLHDFALAALSLHRYLHYRGFFYLVIVLLRRHVYRLLLQNFDRSLFGCYLKGFGQRRLRRLEQLNAISWRSVHQLLHFDGLVALEVLLLQLRGVVFQILLGRYNDV